MCIGLYVNTHSILVHYDTASTQNTPRCSTALESVKHVEVTFLLLSLRRQHTRYARIPDDYVSIRTHRNTTLITQYNTIALSV